MRVWDVPVELLCNQHLLGEHNEIHVLYNTLVNSGSGWKSHVETKRWRYCIDALVARHDAQVVEMQRRGWSGHKTPMMPVGDSKKQIRVWQTIPDQIAVLESRKCKCQTAKMRQMFCT